MFIVNLFIGNRLISSFISIFVLVIRLLVRGNCVICNEILRVTFSTRGRGTLTLVYIIHDVDFMKSIRQNHLIYINGRIRPISEYVRLFCHYPMRSNRFNEKVGFCHFHPITLRDYQTYTFDNHSGSEGLIKELSTIKISHK